MMTLLGEPVELVPEPKNKYDSNAIAVISPRGGQIGYLSAERAPYIGGRMSRGEDAVAIFQGMGGGSALVRVRFGGGGPTLPPVFSAPIDSSRCLSRRHDPESFYPDDDGPDWGACPTGPPVPRHRRSAAARSGSRSVLS
jgi:hypothetical protein